ncbi:hypothetical protein EJP02_481 [Escherichia phage EJP2]|nr:hypothetical protein EJP02_481 [Escherichia phage EJP2]
MCNFDVLDCFSVDEIIYEPKSHNSVSPGQYEKKITELFSLNDHNVVFIGFNMKTANEWQAGDTKVHFKLVNKYYEDIFSDVTIEKIIKKFKKKTYKPKHKKLTMEIIEYQAKAVSYLKGHRIISFGPFDGALTKIEMECLMDSHTWSTSYNSYVTNDKGCVKCGIVVTSEFHRTNHDDVNLFLKENGDINNYDLYEEFIYSNNLTIIKRICKICNHGKCGEWKTSYECIKNRDHQCPVCKTTEARCIKRDLDPIFSGFGVVECEKKYDDCRMINHLRYDRFIPKLNMLFEYDGEQHFNKRNIRWHGESGEKRDQIKTEFAINNGYNFIRIAYYEDHVAVLESFLKLIEENPGKQIVQIYGDVKII